MPRDPGLEQRLAEALAGVEGLSGKPMFGGWALLLNDHRLCGARQGSLLVRLGKDRDGWALALPDIAPMVMRGRPMSGWVRAEPPAYGDDALLRRLLSDAVAFVGSLAAR